MRAPKPCPPDRVPCAIPFCGRTFKREYDEQQTICGKHWRLGPAAARQRYSWAKRRLKREMDLERQDRLRDIVHRAWCRVRDHVIGSVDAF